ncbi:hypothetical protein N431DRAFT_476029 [Stipitochalara longipes BDJ]|nr:hypothetical protein N431DRAFT_476029 [Stipitochalara longipes BDJ]
MSSPHNAQQMLQFLSYQRRDIDNSVIYYPASKLIPLKPLPSRPPSRALLPTLPLELLTTILLPLSFADFAALRLTCLDLNLAVDSLREFQLVTNYASAVLRSLKVTGFDGYHSVAKIAKGLVEPNCVLCGAFGPYFSLMKGERVCYPCVFEKRELRVLFRSVAERYFGISSNNTSLRELHTLILKGSENGEAFRKERVLVSFDEAREEAVRLHGGEEKMHRHVFEVQSKDYEACRRDNASGGSCRQRPAYQSDQDELLETRINYAPVLGDLLWMEDFPKGFALRGCTLFPWLDEKKGWTEMGVWCRGCAEEREREKQRLPDWRRIRLCRDGNAREVRLAKRAIREGEFVMHVEGCEGAMEIWERRPVREGEMSYIS